MPNRLGAIRAVAIVAAAITPVLLTGIAGAMLMPKDPANSGRGSDTEYTPPPHDVADRLVRHDFERIAVFLEAELRAGRTLPWDEDELYERWRAEHSGESEPRDPYDGMPYGYEQRGEHFRIWSAGPDDDPRRALRYDSRRPPSPE